MIWLRAVLLAVVCSLVVLALTQPSADPAPAPTVVAEVPAPTPRPTRVPLPTSPPQMIISRISRETPTPRPLTVQLGEPRVSVVDNGYLPSQLTIAPGAHVTWANTGSEGHDVSGNGPGGMWQSGPLGPADRYQRPFVLAGNYDYWCSIHPEMRGRVVVQP